MKKLKIFPHIQTLPIYNKIQMNFKKLLKNQSLMNQN